MRGSPIVLTISIITILLSIVNGQTNYDYFNVTFPLYGGKNFCSACEGGLENVDHYEIVMNDAEQDFNFTDPLPPGYQLPLADAYLLGSFSCASGFSSPTNVSLQLCSSFITSDYPVPIVGNSGCGCPNCQSMIKIENNDNLNKWWPGYAYGSTNSFRFRVISNQLSISNITLSLKAQNIAPIVRDYFPTTFSLNFGGKVSVLAVNTFDTFQYKCVFTSPIWNATTFAEPPNPPYNLFYLCDLPAILYPIKDKPSVLNVNFTFYPDTMITKFPSSSGPFPITLYGIPVIESVSPNHCSQTGGTTVIINGTNFYDSGKLMCKFGNKIVNATFTNQSLIECVTPPQDDSAKVDLFVTEDLHAWSNSLPFTYDQIPSPLTPSSHFIIIIVCSTVSGLILILGFIYIVFIRRRTDYNEIPDLEPSLIIPKSDLHFIELIGRGNFGSVYKATWRHCEVAVKKIPDANEVMINELIDEARIMVGLRHPNIVTFMGCTTKPEVYLITEYVARGNLYNILHDRKIFLELQHIKKMAIDTSSGMAYLHGAKIVHRDLKCHNLLVDHTWSIKVADFGLSRGLEEKDPLKNTMTACGTPQWTAPEVLRNQHYTSKVDVYSFGICLWEMVTREDPYDTMPPYQVVISVATKGLRPQIPEECHPEFSKVITKCWDDNPEDRPDFGSLIEIFETMDLPKPSSPYPVVIPKKGRGKQIN